LGILEGRKIMETTSNILGIMDGISELTGAGILVVLILKLVFDFLKEQKAKKVVTDQTQYFAKTPGFNGETKKISENVAEIHDVLLAQPPRQSVVSTLAKVDDTLRDQVQRQKEAVHVLEEIRDELRTHGPKLDDAKCAAKDEVKKS